MSQRAFPVVFAQHPTVTATFYERLGFNRQFQLPEDTDEPGYIGLVRGTSEVAVVDAAWPADQYNGTWTPGMRFEMFVYVDDVETAISAVREVGSAVLREPADMPWGERVAYVADPDGNPVAIAAAS